MNLSFFNITNSYSNINRSRQINDGITYLMVLGILNLVGFIINSITMAHSLRNRRALATIDHLLRNLLLSNIFNSLAWIIATANKIVAKQADWPLYTIDIACKLKNLFWLTCYTISVFILTLLSIERYRAIIYPTKSRLRGRKLYVIILLTWLSSIITSFPIIFITTVDLVFELDCSLKIEKPSIFYFIYVVFLQIVDYILPLCIMLYCYSHTIIKLGKISINVITNKTALFARQRRKKRCIKMLIWLTACFIITALPWMFRFNVALFRNNLLSFIFHQKYNYFLNNFFQSIPLITLLSLTYNPIFYFLFYRCNRRVENVHFLGNRQQILMSRKLTVVND